MMSRNHLVSFLETATDALLAAKKFRKAAASWQRVLQERRGLVRQMQDDPPYRRALALSTFRLATLLREIGDIPGSVENLEEARVLLQAFLEEAPATTGPVEPRIRVGSWSSILSEAFTLLASHIGKRTNTISSSTIATAKSFGFGRTSRDNAQVNKPDACFWTAPEVFTSCSASLTSRSIPVED
jgi:hypothetical protein